jgi:hypothetical protein
MRGVMLTRIGTLLVLLGLFVLGFEAFKVPPPVGIGLACVVGGLGVQVYDFWRASRKEEG